MKSHREPVDKPVATRKSVGLWLVNPARPERFSRWKEQPVSIICPEVNNASSAKNVGCVSDEVDGAGLLRVGVGCHEE
jgi:hypothetical protein